MKNSYLLKFISSAAVLFSFNVSTSLASTTEGIDAIKEGDCATALVKLVPAAEKGDIKAQKILGELYSKGDQYCVDFQTNSQSALQWYLKAATLGDSEAQHKVASMYQFGSGIPEDKANAFKWLGESAAQGNAEDLEALSKFYEKGDIVPIDRVLTYTYLGLAVKIKSRNKRNYTNNALSYYADNITPDQIAEAKKIVAKWQPGMVLPTSSKTGHLLPSAFYQKAASAGNAQALYKLGMIQRNNLENNGNQKEALSYLRAAAEKGHQEAQATLARIYLCGQCGPVDFVLSYMMSTLSVQGKSKKIKAEVADRWDDALTDEQLAEAKVLIADWRMGTPFPHQSKTGHQRKINYAEEKKFQQPATPEVIRLFSAASEGDEKTFNQLIDATPNINDWVIDGNMLLHVLMHPAKSLMDSERKWLEENEYRPTAEHVRSQRAIHLTTLSAKTRMLAVALQRGASVQEGTAGNNAAALHLATVYGSPEMVKMLLQHGADANQYGGENYGHQAIDFSLNLAEHKMILRELVTPEQRTQIILDLLAAGAKMPYRQIDKQTVKETKKPIERPAADYLLWEKLVSLTVGSEVLSLMEKTGTKPSFEPGQKSVLAYAAQAGNIEGVKWLIPRVPTEGRKALLTDAAIWAMYGNPENVDAILSALVAQGIDWNQTGPNSDDSASKNYRLLSLPNPPELDNTLLGHAVHTGQDQWASNFIKAGAPVVALAESRGTPLAVAVRDGNVKMVTLLLGLGADPMLGGQSSPLIQIFELDTYNKNTVEIMALLLKKLIEEKKSIPDELGQDIAGRAFIMRENEELAVATIKALVGSGFAANKLGAQNIAYAMQIKDRGLIDFLIAQGALKSEGSSTLAEAYSMLLEVALVANREDLLPILLAAGLDPNVRLVASELTPTEYAIKNGYTSALKLFVKQFAIPTSSGKQEWGTVLDLAVMSQNEDVLRLMTNEYATQLTQVCLPDTTMLTEVLLESSDQYWATLIKHGFGSNVNGCDKMIDRFVIALGGMQELQQVGWVGQQLTQRIMNLSSEGKRLNALLNADTYEGLTDYGRQDIIFSLQAAGWEPPKTYAPQATEQIALTSAHNDLVLSKKLIGHYYLQDVREVGSELVLYDEGRFQYFLSYGAEDQTATGKWQVVNGKVILRSKVVLPKVPFQLMNATPAMTENAKVTVEFQKQVMPGVFITILGDHGIKESGMSTTDGFSIDHVGPIRQIILSHQQVNRSRPFVYNLPDADVVSTKRHYRFELHLPKNNDVDFNVDMNVKNGQLVFTRNEHEMRYKREQ